MFPVNAPNCWGQVETQYLMFCPIFVDVLVHSSKIIRQI